MEPTSDPRWPQALAQLAAQVEYPPTPDIAARLRAAGPAQKPPARPIRPAGRRLAWAVVVAGVVLLGLLAVPATRAALLSFFARVGGIEIFIDETVPTATPPATAPPAAPEGVPHSLALANLGEPSTLAEAARQAHFTPALPATLGAPDAVYTHPSSDLPAITLVWQPDDGPPLSLTAIAVAEFARKFVAAEAVVEVAVSDGTGLWLAGPHQFELLGSYEGQNRVTITSNVLLWVYDGITYRLEGDVSQAEAIAIAESLGQ